MLLSVVLLLVMLGELELELELLVLSSAAAAGVAVALKSSAQAGPRLAWSAERMEGAIMVGGVIFFSLFFFSFCL